MGCLLSYCGEGDSNKKENKKIQSNKEVKQRVLWSKSFLEGADSKIKIQIARATIIANIVDINDIDIIN